MNSPSMEVNISAPLLEVKSPVYSPKEIINDRSKVIIKLNYKKYIPVNKDYSGHKTFTKSQLNFCNSQFAELTKSFKGLKPITLQKVLLMSTLEKRMDLNLYDLFEVLSFQLDPKFINPEERLQPQPQSISKTIRFYLMEQIILPYLSFTSNPVTLPLLFYYINKWDNEFDLNLNYNYVMIISYLLCHQSTQYSTVNLNASYNYDTKKRIALQLSENKIVDLKGFFSLNAQELQAIPEDLLVKFSHNTPTDIYNKLTWFINSVQTNHLDALGWADLLIAEECLDYKFMKNPDFVKAFNYEVRKLLTEQSKFRFNDSLKKYEYVNEIWSRFPELSQPSRHLEKENEVRSLISRSLNKYNIEVITDHWDSKTNFSLDKHGNLKNVCVHESSEIVQEAHRRIYIKTNFDTNKNDLRVKYQHTHLDDYLRRLDDLHYYPHLRGKVQGSFLNCRIPKYFTETGEKSNNLPNEQEGIYYNFTDMSALIWYILIYLNKAQDKKFYAVQYHSNLLALHQIYRQEEKRKQQKQRVSSTKKKSKLPLVDHENIQRQCLSQAILLLIHYHTISSDINLLQKMTSESENIILTVDNLLKNKDKCVDKAMKHHLHKLPRTDLDAQTTRFLFYNPEAEETFYSCTIPPNAEWAKVRKSILNHYQKRKQIRNFNPVCFKCGINTNLFPFISINVLICNSCYYQKTNIPPRKLKALIKQAKNNNINSPLIDEIDVRIRNDNLESNILNLLLNATKCDNNNNNQIEEENNNINEMKHIVIKEPSLADIYNRNEELAKARENNNNSPEEINMQVDLNLDLLPNTDDKEEVLINRFESNPIEFKFTDDIDEEMSQINNNDVIQNCHNLLSIITTCPICHAITTGQTTCVNCSVNRSLRWEFNFNSNNNNVFNSNNSTVFNCVMCPYCGGSTSFCRCAQDRTFSSFT